MRLFAHSEIDSLMALHLLQNFSVWVIKKKHQIQYQTPHRCEKSFERHFMLVSFVSHHQHTPVSQSTQCRHDIALHFLLISFTIHARNIQKLHQSIPNKTELTTEVSGIYLHAYYTCLSNQQCQYWVIQAIATVCILLYFHHGTKSSH